MAEWDQDFLQKLPKRIILVRHGESQGNIDEAKYEHIPDSQIELTEEGKTQAVKCGEAVRQIIEQSTATPDDWRVHFYVSPYKRTLSTLRYLGRAFPRKRVLGVREEVRIREQDFGNFQHKERMQKIKETRQQFGRFFYRFPEGESTADVFDRVASFMESLWRDIDMNRIRCPQGKPCQDLTLVLVTHGLTGRVFMMKWFKWTVAQFEALNNPQNCDIRVLQLGDGGEYSLAVYHSEEELRQWGLTDDMIAEQKWRATAHRGRSSPAEFKRSVSIFFDHFKTDDGETDLQDNGQHSQVVPEEEQEEEDSL